MKVLWLSWKDYEHPLSGGAETVLREISRRLVQDGHQVTILTAAYDGAAKTEQIDDGIQVIRVGRSRYTHSFRALWYYLRKLRGRYDLVIEVVNTAPYFSPLFRGHSRFYLFYHQLAREVWFSETRPPLGRLGFHVLEPAACRLLAKSNSPVITVSESTKTDLARHGFAPESISIISEGSEVTPVKRLGAIKKFAEPTMLGLGSIRPMKRTLDQVKAFEDAKSRIPELKLILAGDYNHEYGLKTVAYCRSSQFADDIQCLGRVATEQKIDLMKRAHLITATSIKEGWGLTVTESAGQGTPAVVYDVDGLRDSVRHERTGLVTDTNPGALAANIVRLMTDSPLYQDLRREAWKWSREITFDRTYQDFKGVVAT